jgi:HlyD family secretion protein
MVGFRIRFRFPKWFVVAAAALALAPGCHEDSAPSPGINDTSATPSVTVVSPSRRTLVRVIQQPGWIKPYEQTPIYAKIAGYVQKVNVDIGDHVHKGDLLAELWVPEMEQDLKAKEARVSQSVADVKVADEGLKAANANVDTAEAFVNEAIAGVHQAAADYQRWQAEYERGKKLMTQNVYDKQTLDEMTSQMQQSAAGKAKSNARLTSSQAALIESKAKRDKASADVEAATAKLQVAEAEKNQSAAWLNYRDIRAPFDGVVTLRNVHTGHFLQSSSSGSTNKSAEPLFTVMRMDIMRVTCQVPEYDAVLVKERMPAVVHFPALPGKEFPGKVTRFTWSFDEQARTLRAEIHLPNPKEELRPGMYADVTIMAELPDSWTLPSDALMNDGEKTYCYVVTGGKAIRTAVKVGVQAEKMTQVLQKQQKTSSEGKEGDWEDFSGHEEIVALNPDSLIDGQAVTVVGQGNPSDSSTAATKAAAIPK